MEVVMTNILASAPHRAVRRGMGQASRRRYSLATLRNTIAAWRQQTRFRWDLKRISEVNPHLIDDIGLTRRQVDEEIAKLPFWQR
ncbi:hypothetical protein CK228_17050 [Mesorhizobium sp. WSM4312]|nr:hypothetical protein CK232_18270 [Mesorhizobium sp. WSM4304]PBB67514.1 hypothetical protein CK228_17050 [Mesorhizobium sp. WSM4312]PBB75075.1 hypothetical protein CK227_14025 [Mesorhizobium sp. WSM4308]PBC22165.1 hypothetical protein CK226_16145 [Mesorhizobium sp. WSM4311]TRC76214.1 DUF1127 domain-containing protein [Mesorhizobium sp. WSM4315]TRC82675.1 DUF1127 domain-containing protein [Mesorhizobium sp. WSM4310]TRC84031.1 DUF1127 domain-containing protein [Mesorhizobium sp. WSM4307]TRD0